MAWLGAQLSPGEKIKQRIPIGEFSDGTPVLLPVVTITGANDGPTFYLQAGVHGDEVTSIEIARGVIAAIDAKRLNGSLVVVPIANIPAYLTRTRGYLHEERWPIDMNRVFPGSESGLLTERIAGILFKDFLQAADVSVDLHAALDGAAIVPFAYVVPDDDEHGTLALRRRVAHAMGLPYVYYEKRGDQLGTSNVARTMALQGDLVGRAVVDVEMGESRRVTREVVQLGVDAIGRALQELEMLPRDGKPAPRQESFHDITLLHCQHGGGVRLHVSLRDKVQQGQRVGEIVDVFGDTAEELRAPVGGFVVRVLTFANVSTGAEILWIGH